MNAQNEFYPRAADGFSILGQIDSYRGRIVVGWAAIAERFEERPHLELLIDGQPTVLGVANKFRADLVFARIGDGHFGFELTVPLRFCDGTTHLLTVREMVSGKMLEGGPFEFSADLPSLPEPSVTPSAYDDTGSFVAGFLDECLPTGFVGWAARLDGSPAPVEVELLVDGVPAVRVLADLHRADLEASVDWGGSGKHGFRLRAPDQIFDECPHEIQVREVTTQEVLQLGTRTVRFNPCDAWNASEGDARRRRILAGAALTYCEAASDDALGYEIHKILLRMKDWSVSQNNARIERRVQALLDRLTVRRCRVMIDGLTNSHHIIGSLLIDWPDTQPVELDLIEQHRRCSDDAAVSKSIVRSDGSFLFSLPEALLDDDVHSFYIRVRFLGGSLGPWSFLLSAKVQHQTHRASGLSLDPVWDTVPAALISRYADTNDGAMIVSDVENLRLELQDAVAHGGDDESSAAEVVALRCELANSLVESGEFTEALREFEKTAAEHPESVAARTGQINCLMAMGDLRGAKDRLATLQEFDPDVGEFHVLDDEIRAHRHARQARVVAFYLPQFHPTPENNRWWGEGFTEWVNVAAATALFEAHLQPRRPTSLGYYDLRLPEAANAQFELARRYGIDGFCYYYYWFNGRRILEQPLLDLASGRTGPFPFCVCWANEPWTRSWDGTTGEVLLAQKHTPESDFQFIKDLAPILRHPNYIRIEGKPVVMVYRAEMLATPRETAERWRSWCKSEGIGDLHLCAVQSFGFHDPRTVGFDAAVEFPPHRPATADSKDDFHQEILDIRGRVDGFSAKVFSYEAFASRDMKTPREPFPLHRSAMVAWDNTARRKKSAHVFHDFTVATYERWVLNNARKAATEQRDGLCFINAWNEWAEGSVMEPDAHFGYEILEATRRAKRLANFDAKGTYWQNERPLFPEERIAEQERVLLIGHDAFRHGAQINLLNMAWALKRDLGMEVTIMLIEGGDLVEEYERVAPTYLIGRADGWREALQKELRRYKPLGARKAICNTAVTGPITEILKQEGYKIVTLVHELPALIESYGLGAHCWTIAANADRIVFASKLVADEFCTRYWPEEAKVALAPQGIRFNRYYDDIETTRAEVLTELCLPSSSVVVLGCGHGDTRKGIDLFVQMAADVLRQCDPGTVSFVWIGALDAQLAPYIQTDIVRLGLADVFRVTGLTTDPARYFIAGDLFALTSREDPFPSVVMEAFDAQLPVIAFNGGGGYVEIVNEATGALVPYLDVPAMASAVLDYVRDPVRRSAVGKANHVQSRERFGYDQYLRKVMALLADVPAEQVTAGLVKRTAWFSERPRPTVTVIVPNFNYARYLELRLKTILGQTLPPDEIIVLDDASTDDSILLVREIAERSPIPIRLITNQINTGNPFAQWAKGLEHASGDLVWIAEADDYCEPTLLETLASHFVDESIVMAWADSIMVDESGASHGAQYKDYFSRDYGWRWYMNFRDSGRNLIDHCLFAENVVPNASAVLFRRSAVNAADLAFMQRYRFSGDWWFWLSLAQAGDVAYCANPLNYHRRHSRSVMGDVLRAGESLLPEMMSFYGRVSEHRTDCVSHQSGTQALKRVNNIYNSFAALRFTAARISDHPVLSAQYHELSRAIAAAVQPRGKKRRPVITLVVSHDVLGEDMSGAALVRHFDASKALATLIIIAPKNEATTFLERLNAPNSSVRSIILETDSSTARKDGSSRFGIEEGLRAVLEESATSMIVSHGLLAHCVMASAAASNSQEWLLVGGEEFDALLGAPPEDSGIGFDAIHNAFARCSTLQFIGKSPPHVFARIAKTCARPIDRLVVGPRPYHRDKSDLQSKQITCLGIGAHAEPDKWRGVAQALSKLETELECKIRLRLLTWGSAMNELRCNTRDEQNVELVALFDRPDSLVALGDLLLVPATGETVAEMNFDLELMDSSIPLFRLDSVITRSNSQSTADVTSYLRKLSANLKRKASEIEQAQLDFSEKISHRR